jgi:hypothetical protein
MAPTNPGLILHMQVLSCSTRMRSYLAPKAQSELVTGPGGELCMPNILLVRSPFARMPKQEPNDKMMRKTQCKHQRYIKAFADVGSKSIQIKSNLGNHLYGDADFISIVEVAISIQPILALKSKT